MTLSGVGGILGCSLFITGTYNTQEIYEHKLLLMGDTSSAMISDCSSLLKRLERRPPARTLLMYSRKPFAQKNDRWRWYQERFEPPLWCLGQWRGKWCLCLHQNSLISFKIVSPKITCHPSSPEKVFQVLQEVGGVVSPAKSIYWIFKSFYCC